MAFGWVVVALVEWSSWLDRPHFGRGLPPRYYVPAGLAAAAAAAAAGAPARPARPRGPGEEAKTWIASPGWVEELGEWPAIDLERLGAELGGPPAAVAARPRQRSPGPRPARSSTGLRRCCRSPARMPPPARSLAAPRRQSSPRTSRPRSSLPPSSSPASSPPSRSRAAPPRSRPPRRCSRRSARAGRQARPPPRRPLRSQRRRTPPAPAGTGGRRRAARRSAAAAASASAGSVPDRAVGRPEADALPAPARAGRGGAARPRSPRSRWSG